MSWDEKDWAHIWITGMPERFGENSDNISNTSNPQLSSSASFLRLNVLSSLN